jgi:RNA polymerase sigma-70 factor (TIGR02960 family)
VKSRLALLRVQETLLAAWRGIEAFEGRASVGAWLYRIATNRCLNALRDRGRRPQGVPSMVEPLEPTRRIEPIWLEPYPDMLFEDIPDRSPGPAARSEARESIELAFIVALQHLPPRQRAALVLRDVLGFRTAEVAEMLDTSEASVKGALQRARAAVGARLPAADRERAPRPNAARERRLVGRFADAVQRGDVDAMVALLTDDARLTMPPLPLEYQGHHAIGAFLRHREELRGAPLRVMPTRANTQPAFACYLPDAHAAIARYYALFVLTLEGMQSRGSPGSPTPASSATSGFHGPCRAHDASPVSGAPRWKARPAVASVLGAEPEIGRNLRDFARMA